MILTRNKFILLSLTIVLVLAVLLNFKILKYATSQGCGQLKIILNSEKIDDVVKQKTLDLNIKNKLLLVKRVKQFAIDSLQLQATNNYTKVYLPTKNAITLLVINASEKLNLKEYQWHYPIIGDAPYKGFFDKNLLYDELLQLYPENLDVDVGRVEAWSTLGWFNDPLMGSMLKNDDEDLVATIIHEMFHATLFVKSSAQLNENLAEFVGIEGAKRFLHHKKNSKNEIDYFDLKEQKSKAYNLFMHNCAKQLQHLYTSKLNNDEKLVQKKKLLFSFCVELYKKNIFSKEKNRLICSRILNSKNAFFTGFLTYNAKDKKLELELKNKFNSNLQQFINHYKIKFK